MSTLALGAALCVGPVAHAQDAEIEVPEPPPSAPAVSIDDAQPRARVHYEAGAAHYAAGAYEDALREWERAYELGAHAEMLHNLSLAHQRLGHLREAHDYLRRFLDEADAIPDRARLEHRLADLSRLMSQRERAGPAQAAPSVPEPLRSAPPAPEPGPYVSSGAIVGFVASGVGLVTFAVAGVLAIAEDLRLQEACASLCYSGAGDDLRTFALAADLGLGLTIAGAALGLVFLFSDRGPSGSFAVAMLPVVGGEGGGLLVRGRP